MTFCWHFTVHFLDYVLKIVFLVNVNCTFSKIMLFTFFVFKIEKRNLNKKRLFVDAMEKQIVIEGKSMSIFIETFFFILLAYINQSVCYSKNKCSSMDMSALYHVCHRERPLIELALLSFIYTFFRNFIGAVSSTPLPWPRLSIVVSHSFFSICLNF